LLEVGTGFHPELTGRENIYLNGAILGMGRTEIRRRFDEIVEFAEIETFLDTPVKRYSSGMYVRLAFAVAAHLEPEILVIDEVLAVGDAAFQNKCLGKMDNVAREGRTVLFVSHNMAAVSRLCTSAVLLSEGKIGDSGEPGPVITEYVRRNVGIAAVVELTDQQHLVKSPLQVKEVAVLNALGRPSAAIFFGEDVSIRLLVQSSEPLTNVRVGIGIYAEGVRLSTVHTAPTDFTGPEQLRILTCTIPSDAL
jgi:lipopolysaccharide transport system ATP-binding protein